MAQADETALAAQLARLADDLRTRAAFTDRPPTSSRLPVSYRSTPDWFRTLVASVIGDGSAARSIGGRSFRRGRSI
jgi:hypothetical protein